MAQLDAYLVEKLREILQRLYFSNKQNEIADKDQIPTSNQEQPVAHKRSPLLFPFAPTDKLSPGSDVVDGESENYSGELSTDNLESEDRYLENGSNVPTEYYVAPDGSFNDSLSSSYSNVSTIYGTEVMNCSSSGNSSVNDTLGELDKLDKEDESAALTRSLHEFIHILKMSLKSVTTQSYSNGQSGFHTNNYPHQNKDSHSESYGIRRDSLNIGSSSSGQGDGGINTFPGIDAFSTANMEYNYNLTLDDIMDLNSLLQGDEASSGLPMKHVLIIATYFIIACVSIIGNLLVIQLVIRSRRFHTLTHALLANLAAADLVLATINIPFSCARVIMSEWPFGPFLCRAVPFLQVTSVYATSFTMAVIAMDRYQVIMNPLGKRLKCTQGILLVVAIWAVSGLLSLPYALNHKVVTILTVRVVKRCQAEFGFPHARQLLTVATFLAQYLLPLVFTTVSYICIMKRLWHRSSGLGSATPRQVAAQSRAKLKTIKMLILTVFFFAATWLPIHLYHLFTHFSHVRHNSTAILICHIIAMSSSMYNPFIFCGLNEHFRREAVKWLRCFRTRRSPVVHPGMEVNGMLARADQTPRRNMSTTVIHTMLSSRRSPQQQQRPLSSPRSGQRRGILATSSSSTTAAVYMTPRHGGTGSNQADRGVGSSPTVARLVTSMNSSSRNGSSTSGYQPELLFLVRDTILSHNDNFDLEGMDSIDEDINAEDFLDGLGDEMGLYQSRARKGNQYARDNDDDILSEESNGGGGHANVANEEKKSDENGGT